MAWQGWVKPIARGLWDPVYRMRAVKNIYGRLKETPQYTAGAGGVPTWRNLASAIKPQTAYAAEPLWPRGQIGTASQSSDGGGGGGGGSTARGGGSYSTASLEGTPTYVPRNVTFLGIQYDVNDPAQFYALKNAQMDYLDAQNRGTLGILSENLYKTTGYRGTEAPITLENVGGDIGRQKTSFLQNILDVLGEYDVREKENLANVGAYYSGLGDITQSSQATRTGLEKEKFTTARGKVERQKQEGLTSLERALQDYLGGYGQDTSGVATQYQTARDEIANATDQTISDTADNLTNLKFQYANALYSGQDPTLIREEIAKNQDILNGLIGLRGGNIFKRFGTQGGGANVPAILKYLYPQGA